MKMSRVGCMLSLCVLALGLVHTARGMDIFWSDTTNDWNNGPSWGGTVPGSGDAAAINNGGLAILSNTPADAVREAWIGQNGGSGSLDILDGTLQVNDWFVIGRLWDSPASNVSTGICTMTGGRVQGNFNSEIGWNNGSGATTLGRVIMSGTSEWYNVGFIHLGANFGGGAGGRGEVELHDNAFMWISNNDGGDCGLELGTSSGSANYFTQNGNSKFQFRTPTNYGWWVSIGTAQGSYGQYDLNGGTITAYTGDAGSFTGDGFIIGGSGTGVLNVGNGSAIIRDLFIGKWNTGVGTVNQTGGLVEVGVTIPEHTESRMGGWDGGQAGAQGFYNLSGGILSVDPNFQVGAWGLGVFRQTGGDATFRGWTTAGRFSTGNGRFDVQGGSLTHTANGGTHLIIGEDGTGVLTVSSNGVVTLNNELWVGHNLSGVGTVNLVTGGTLQAVGAQGNAGNATMNFNGGIFRSVVANGAIFGFDAATVYGGGAIFDSQGYELSVNQNLLDGGGGGGIVKLGPGVLRLGGTSTFTGRTIVNNGSVWVTQDLSLGAVPGAYVADQIWLDGTTLQNNESAPVIHSNRGITVTANGGYLQDGWGTGNPLTIDSRITGPGLLGINHDSGPVILACTSNDWTGDTIIGATGPDWWAPGAYAWLKVGGTDVIPNGAGKGNVFIDALHVGLLDLNGFNETINGLRGDGLVSNTAAVASTLFVGDDNRTMVFDGRIRDDGTGTVRLVKIGTGTQTLNGASAYAGGTDIQDGGLFVHGTITGATHVASGASLGGTGLVSGAVTVDAGGLVAPGASAGVLTVGETFTLQAGAKLDIELGGINPGSEHDVLSVLGAAQLDGNLNVSFLAPFLPVPDTFFTSLTASAIGGAFGNWANGGIKIVGDVGVVAHYGAGSLFATNELVLEIIPSDADGDGLLVTLDPDDHNPNTDGGDAGDFEEYVAYGSATSAFERFVIQNEFRAGAGNAVIVWPSLAGRLYSLDMATNLPGEPLWSPLATDLPGPQGAYTNPTLDRTEFYRVRVRLAP